MGKLSEKWVPRIFTPNQNVTSLNISRGPFARLQCNPENFLKGVVEIWVRYFGPESKYAVETSTNDSSKLHPQHDYGIGCFGL